MPISKCALLRWQLDLTWSLFELHLEELHPDDFLWEPAELCWTVRQGDGGTWVADWAETEPDPIPVPTIGWLTWHILWWLGMVLDHMQGRAIRDRADVTWPGPGQPAIDGLRGLCAEWREVLDRLEDADLDTVTSFPWRDDPDMTVAHTVAWVNAELMKNAAEIGQLRLLRTGDRRRL